MPRKSSLSVCIVTQDMAHFLGYTLGNISDLADEIVVVDGGSVDGTVELARSFPKVRLLHRRFDGNFAAQKNFAVENARCDWVMILDADELLGDRMRAQIPDLLQSRFYRFFKFARYWVVSANPWRYVDSPKHFPDYQLRLFRNRPFFRYPNRSIVHTHFPREGRGFGRKLRDAYIFHCDFMLKGRAQRESKVAWYLKLDPPSAKTSQMYLYEEIPHVLRPCEDHVSTLGREAHARLDKELEMVRQWSPASSRLKASGAT